MHLSRPRHAPTPSARPALAAITASALLAAVPPAFAAPGIATVDRPDALPRQLPRAVTRLTLPETPLHPRAALGLRQAYSGPPVDVLTYHHDPGRTGWNPSETDLTPATVASGRFGLLKTLAVDGDVFAQPLVVTGVKGADGLVRDLLLVATMNNSVYAFDARTYATVWQVNLGPKQRVASIGCGDAANGFDSQFATCRYVGSATITAASGAKIVAIVNQGVANTRARFTYNTFGPQ